jgi:hypothetical protein
LQDIVVFVEQLEAPADAEVNRDWYRLQTYLKTAQKILDDRADPERGHLTRSIVDADARRGKHGQWYDGYLVDVMMDADSELLTEVNVLEAGGDEAQSAVEMVRREQETHSSQIEQLSIDGIGFNGKMIRELEDPYGLNVQVIVPPKKEQENGLIPSSEFKVIDDGKRVICPAGQTSSYQQLNKGKNATIYRFKRSQCDSCPLVVQCMPKPETGLFGRSVSKNDYEAEYDRIRARASTEAYQSVRKRHPAIERKLNEILNHHDSRHARYWGLAKVAVQQTMTAFTVNFKRTLQLLACAKVPATA